MKTTMIPVTRIAVFCCVVMLSSVAWSANDMKDGTFIDSYIGMVWLKNANCFGKLSWAEAKSKVASLASGQCGLTDGSKAGQWRLPTSSQQLAIMPSDIQGFSNPQQSWYWSGDTSSGNSNYAMVMSLGGGMTSELKTTLQNVVPVRSR